MKTQWVCCIFFVKFVLHILLLCGVNVYVHMYNISIFYFMIVMSEWHNLYVCEVVFTDSHTCYYHVYIFVSLYYVFSGVYL